MPSNFSAELQNCVLNYKQDSGLGGGCTVRAHPINVFIIVVHIYVKHCGTTCVRKNVNIWVSENMMHDDTIETGVPAKPQGGCGSGGTAGQFN